MNKPDNKTQEQESLIEFPCLFPIKVMGEAHEAFPEAVLNIVKEHAPTTSPEQMQTRHSSKKGYMSITIHVPAESKTQLDNIYLALTNHHLVKVVL